MTSDPHEGEKREATVTIEGYGAHWEKAGALTKDYLKVSVPSPETIY